LIACAWWQVGGWCSLRAGSLHPRLRLLQSGPIASQGPMHCHSACALRASAAELAGGGIRIPEQAMGLVETIFGAANEQSM
jgi:hypothetical protein